MGEAQAPNQSILSTPLASGWGGRGNAATQLQNDQNLTARREIVINHNRFLIWEFKKFSKLRHVRVADTKDFSG